MKIGAHLFELYLHQRLTNLDKFWCTRKQNTMPNPYLCKTVYPQVWHGVLLTCAPEFIQIGQKLVEI